MIGVLGGTFDPIHFGHLRPALDVLQALGLREVRLIPLRSAVHRDAPAAAAQLRWAMVEAATAGVPGLVPDDRELRRQGGSYTYDTLVSLRGELGPDVPLCLLLGADAFAGFLDWHRPADILALAHLVVMRRPGVGEVTDPDLRAWAEPRRAGGSDELARAPGGRILYQEVTQLDISATAIRALVARGASPRFLLPDAVLGLIDHHGLYGNR